MKSHELLQTYKMMLCRCYNQNYNQFSDYGGRGITVCDAWKNSFRQFVIDMGERPKGCTLDRKDNSKGYSPENCVWASRTQQQRNTRRNHRLVSGGISKPISQWAAETGISKNTILKRIRSGWTDEAAIKTPVNVKMRNKAARFAEIGAAQMTPDRAECIAWLERQGWTVYHRGPSRIVVVMGKTAIGYQSAQQAYRRLGGI